ncbi:MAG: 2-oxoglutarate dehydrogenase complex dihydrolipoyllysine-residue succinyltransferase [bacterium]|nr:2-oxoglutarate dehydrogenase complex dihydrolipoyllysine-residue succinyltransferase [bacterium]
MDVTIPRVGESVQEAFLAQWYKQNGDIVHKDEPLFLIETDKVTLEIAAEEDGQLAILVHEEESVAVGAVVGTLDTDAAPEVGEAVLQEIPPEAPLEKEGERDAVPLEGKDEDVPPFPKGGPGGISTDSELRSQLSPSVRRLVVEKQIEIGQISGSGPSGKITKGDLLLHLEQNPAPQPAPDTSSPAAPVEVQEPVTRKVMSPLRKRIAARLLEAKHNTAMLTTFNEIDMSRIIAIRAQYKELFQKKHGVSLGFMSFFAKACVEALQDIPELNAFIEDDYTVYHHYVHIGIAIGSERGLVVPVVRHAEKLSFAEIEQVIISYVEKIKSNKLELSDLEGGTFTITNGGVFGSLLSTPLLNMPQSGILGMHKIEKRPIVINDEIVIRPMMYVALSYDHRVVDGKGAVTFLKRVKECLENPERLLFSV